MNPANGQIFYGDDEFLKQMEKDSQETFVPISTKSFEEVQLMPLIQRKAWAKRERKRLRRLEERQRLRDKQSK